VPEQLLLWSSRVPRNLTPRDRETLESLWTAQAYRTEAAHLEAVARDLVRRAEALEAKLSLPPAPRTET